MNKLKRSRAAKILAFALCFLCGGLAVLHVLAIGYAYRQNLMYVSKEALEQKICSYAAEYMENDVVRYFETSRQRDAKGSDYESSELTLYRSKYDASHCSAGFAVTDGTGKTLLSNFEVKNPKYTFSREFSLFAYPGRESEPDTTLAPEREWTTSAATEPTSSPEEDTTAAPDPEPTSAAAEETTAAPAPDTTAAPAPEPTSAAENAKPYELYILGAEEEGESIGFLYLYPAGDALNEPILEFCITRYREGKLPETWSLDEGEYAIFCQDEYGVSANGKVYRTNGASALRNAFMAREVYPEATTYAEVSEPYETELYTVTVFVPAAANKQVKDVFYYAGKATNLLYGYKNVAIPAAVALALLSLLCAVFFLASAGYVKASDAPVCGGVHKWPPEILLAILAGFVLLIFAAADEIYIWNDMFPFFAIPAFALLLLLLLETLIVRLRTHTLWKNTLLARGLALFRTKGASLLRRLSDRVNVLWKFGLWYVLSGIVALVFLIAADAGAAPVIVYLIVKALELPAGLLLVLNFDLIARGTKELAQGRFGTKIQSRILFGEFRKQAEQLNSINDSVQNAVAERVKSESMKTELITNVSHDLKTPLTSIVNYVDLLSRERIDNPKAREYIEVIARQAERLKRLTEDVVEASKASTGNIQVNAGEMDLGVLFGQIHGEYEALLAEKRLETSVSVPETPVRVFADGRLLWRVFDNLMRNIVKYAQPGTRVYLSLLEENGAARAVFRNISAAPLNITPEELTERFVRGDAARSTDGSGLGLSISKSLTELMGGAFTVAIDGDLFKVTVSFPTIPRKEGNQQ